MQPDPADAPCGSSDGNGAADTAVTKIVDRIPRPGMEQQLEQAIKDLINAAMRYPGHLGVTVTRPAPPVQPGFRLVYRFDTCDHMRAWEESPEYGPLVAAANRFTQGEPQRSVLSGLEAWFTLPGKPTAPPPRGKITVLTWIGIFPLVFAYSQLANFVLPAATPAIARIAIVTALVVPTMAYVVGPLLTRAFRGWLTR
jgi:antibiotic biosynthesis monooxygenase (ABM) superfamily enzyme